MKWIMNFWTSLFRRQFAHGVALGISLERKLKQKQAAKAHKKAVKEKKKKETCNDFRKARKATFCAAGAHTNKPRYQGGK